MHQLLLLLLLLCSNQCISAHSHNKILVTIQVLKIFKIFKRHSKNVIAENDKHLSMLILKGFYGGGWMVNEQYWKYWPCLLKMADSVALDSQYSINFAVL